MGFGQPTGPPASARQVKDLLALVFELAVAGGDLVPGARRWKQRQADLVRVHLTTARIELGGPHVASRHRRGT